MQIKKPSNRLTENLLLPIVLSSIVFFIITGGGILSFTNVDWLMHSDPAQYWLGWQFFRETPLLQWPLTANPALGMTISSTLVYTDSHPLFALFFKLFNPWLPENFQYLGLVILSCFIFQGFFAWKLIGLITHDIWYKIFTLLFFLLAPVFINRLGGHYTSSLAQFGVLAAIYFYFSPVFKQNSWLFIIAFLSSFAFYILFMCLGLLVLDLFQRAMLTKIKWRYAITFLSSAFIIVIVMVWFVGGFALKDPYGWDLFGQYRMDLLSPFNSKGSWSYFLPAIPTPKNQNEGFNYLGTGMLALLIISLFLMTKKHIPQILELTFHKKVKSEVFASKKSQSNYLLWPLIFYVLTLTILATTNKISFAGNDVFTWEASGLFSSFGNTFRASGRFFWPVGYLIYFGIFWVVWKYCRRQTALVIVALMLFLHIADSSKVWTSLKSGFQVTPYYSTMSSPIWQKMAKNAKQVEIIPPFIDFTQNEHWITYIDFAKKNHLAINSYYAARFDYNKYYQSISNYYSTLPKGELDNNSIYIFSDIPFWQWVSAWLSVAKSPTHVFGILDGQHFVVANNSNLPLLDFDREKYKYSGELINNSDNEFNLFGWLSLNKAGVWSNELTSGIVIYPKNMGNNDLVFKFQSGALLTKTTPSQKMSLWVNHQKLAEFNYKQGNNTKSSEIKIPKSLIQQGDGLIVMEFRMESPMINLFIKELGRQDNLGINLMQWSLSQ